MKQLPAAEARPDNAASEHLRPQSHGANSVDGAVRTVPSSTDFESSDNRAEHGSARLPDYMPVTRSSQLRLIFTKPARMLHVSNARPYRRQID
jgi:hypothetical protein